MPRNKTAVFLIAFFIVLGAAFMGYYYYTMPKQKVLPIAGNPGHKVGPFSFVNQDGQVITDQDVAGKVYIAEYFFTTCQGICPRMNQNMTRVYKAMRSNPDFMILSHTVDPKKDTPAALRAYADQYGADGKQWVFLTGDKKALYDLARKGYLITAADDTASTDIASDFIHTNRFVLVDRHGNIRGSSYDGTDSMEVLRMIGDIKELLRQ